MDVMLVGGSSPMMRKLSLKLYKEGHRVFVLTGNRNPSERFEHVFERYDFPYSASSVEEVFRSVNPDVTIILGAFDGNFVERNSKTGAVEFIAGLQNVLLSWSALNKGRLIYLSSAEVYGSSYVLPVSENVTPVPSGIGATAILQGEESCKFYCERLKRDVVVLRIDCLYDIPQNKSEAEKGILEKKCLDAFRNGTITYKKNYAYGLTYAGDAVEGIYKVVLCENHKYGVYNISSTQKYSEDQMANAIDKAFEKETEKIDNTLEEQNFVILSGSRFSEEFGFKVKYTPEEIVQKTVKFMKRHSGRFLDSEHPGLSIWRRIYYKVIKLLGAWFPYFENLVLFIPFFMLNNRATESLYFSKIDFYLIYVLIFAVVHGQRQATFSGVLATAGYIFRQMYGKTGIAVVTDYNTYVWIAEIFIVGLVVGFMKDRINFLKEEKEQEVEFLAERVTDITDINDSNLRVKEGLITQVVNYDYSLGTVYDMIEQLGEDHPINVLFRALTLIRNVTDCNDVSVYLIDSDNNARLFGYTSEKARTMGHKVNLPQIQPIYDAISKNIVYLNRNMDSNYPMMAYCPSGESKPGLLIMLWSIPFERMTIDESNRLIVLCRLIKKAANRAAGYLELQAAERLTDGGKTLKYEPFLKLVAEYREAKKKYMTDYNILKVISSETDNENTADIISKQLHPFDCIGCGKNGERYILLSGSSESEYINLKERLMQSGIVTELTEETEL